MRARATTGAAISIAGLLLAAAALAASNRDSSPSSGDEQALIGEARSGTVRVDLGRSGHIKTQARAMHPSAAIDRAADRTAWLIGRRIGRDSSVKSPAFSF